MKWVTLWIRWKNIGPLWGSSNIFWNFIMDLFSNYGNTIYNFFLNFQSFDPLQYPNIHILHSHACSYEYIYSFITHGCVMHAIKIVILSNILSFFFEWPSTYQKFNILSTITTPTTNKNGSTRKQGKLEK